MKKSLFLSLLLFFIIQSIVFAAYVPGQLYIISLGSGLTLTSQGELVYTLPIATSSTLGGVMPDGTTISNSAGAISVANPNPTPVANEYIHSNSLGTAYTLDNSLESDGTHISVGGSTTIDSNSRAQIAPTGTGENGLSLSLLGSTYTGNAFQVKDSNGTWLSYNPYSSPYGINVFQYNNTDSCSYGPNRITFNYTGNSQINQSGTNGQIVVQGSVSTTNDTPLALFGVGAVSAVGATPAGFCVNPNQLMPGTLLPFQVLRTSQSSANLANIGLATFNAGSALSVPGFVSVSALTSISTLSAIVVGSTGTNYYYEVTEVSGNGETLGSNEVQVSAASTLNSSNYVTLTWTSDPRAVSYNIYRGTSSGTETKLTLVSTQYTKPYIDNGTASTSSTTLPTTNTTGYVTGNIAASNINSGTIGTARLGSGTASSTTYLAGNSTWTSPVTSLTGTANQVSVSASTGAVTLSFPSTGTTLPGTTTLTGHLVSAGTTSTVAIGTYGSGTPSITGTDTAGKVTLTGSASGGIGPIATVSFGTAYTSSPKAVIVCPATTTTPNLSVTSVSTSSFVVNTNTAAGASASLGFYYYVIQ